MLNRIKTPFLLLILLCLINPLGISAGNLLAPAGARDTVLKHSAHIFMQSVPSSSVNNQRWWQDPSKNHLAVSLPLYSLRKEGNDPGIGKFTDFPRYYREVLLPQGVDTILLLPHFAISDESPYAPISMYALNELYIDWSEIPEVKQLLLENNALRELLFAQNAEQQSVHYREIETREGIIAKLASKRFKNVFYTDNARYTEFMTYVEENKFWIEEYAEFKAIDSLVNLKDHTFIPANKWTEGIIAQAKRDSSFDELCWMYKYKQWVASQQLQSALKETKQLRGHVLFDLPFFRCKHSVDVWKNPQNFLNGADGDSHPGIERDDIVEVWQDLASWNWKELKKDNYAFILNQVRYWLAMGFDGMRCDAMHFAYSFFGKRYVGDKPGDEPGDDFVAALAALAEEYGALPLAEAYENKSGIVQKQGFLTVGGDWKHLSYHDDPRFYNGAKHPVVAFKKRFRDVHSQKFPGESARFISFTLGDQWGDPFNVKDVKDGKSYWQWRVPLERDADYHNRVRYDATNYLAAQKAIDEGDVWQASDAISQTLLDAADTFVNYKTDGSPELWAASWDWFFEEWGRDVFISLPGILLATSRFKVAKDIIYRFARYEQNGIIPNRIPDPAHPERNEYNTVDGSLWFIQAVKKYMEYNPGDTTFLTVEIDEGKTLFDAMRNIMRHYKLGTAYERYGVQQRIYMDEDGLIVSPPQATWMDADPRGDDNPVTPRDGKCVEINALWFANLKLLAFLEDTIGDKKQVEEYEILALKVKDSFNKKFWNENEQALYDFVPVKNNRDKHSGAIRPNMIFAVSHGGSLLSPERQKKVLECVQKDLLTPYGLRTLSPRDSHYKGKYDIKRRPEIKDKAYHQGTVWPWLMGAYIDAFAKVQINQSVDRRNITKSIQTEMTPLIEFLMTFYASSLPEVFDGNAPHRPGGTRSQAWSIAEVLRVLAEYGVLPPFIPEQNLASPQNPNFRSGSRLFEQSL
ncbi:MAG: 4-alpha-glucanotransferase [bacterium]